MRKIILSLTVLLALSSPVRGEQALSDAQVKKAESTVMHYFDLLSRYAAQPMGEEGAELRTEIVLMFENMFETPVYNDLSSQRDITGLGTSCTIDDYLLSFGVLDAAGLDALRITYDSVTCRPLVEPSYVDGYEGLNALVYVRKRIEGGNVAERLTNVIRYNLATGKIAYIEKDSFSTSDEDVDFLLRNHLGYSTAKLSELAARCYREGKYKQAYLLYEQATLRDDIDAQFALVNMLLKREGCDEYGEFATKCMALFWLKKIYVKYHANDGIKLHDIGIWRPVEQMMRDLVFSAENNNTYFVGTEAKPFNSGLMMYKVEGKNLYGFINAQGEFAIPPKFYEALAFSEGLAGVREKEDGRWGYINPQGQVVIPAIYEHITPFMNGTASVGLTGDDGKKVYFVINKRGEKISEHFEYLGWRNWKSDMIMVAKRGNKWGFVNGLGQVKVPFVYDEYKARAAYYASSVEDHYVPVLQDGKWGVIDTGSSEGKSIVPPTYKAVGTFAFGMAWVSDGTGYSFVNTKGEIVCGKYADCVPFNAYGYTIVRNEKGSKEAYIINKRGEIVYYCDWHNNNKVSNLRRKK